MNAPPAPEDYTPPQSAVLVPMVHWDRIMAAVPAEGPLRAELARLEETRAHHDDPEEGSIAYQILDVLAKSDGNLTEHMSRHMLVVMYGEMLQHLTETFNITRKEQING